MEPSTSPSDRWSTFGASVRRVRPRLRAKKRSRHLVAVTGFEQLEVDIEGGTLRKAHERLSDRSLGHRQGLCRRSRVGSARETRTAAPHGGDRWRGRARGFNGCRGDLANRHRTATALHGRSVQLVVPLADLALATSGDYRNFFRARRGADFSHHRPPYRAADRPQPGVGLGDPRELHDRRRIGHRA